MYPNYIGGDGRRYGKEMEEDMAKYELGLSKICEAQKGQSHLSKDSFHIFRLSVVTGVF